MELCVLFRTIIRIYIPGYCVVIVEALPPCRALIRNTATFFWRGNLTAVPEFRELRRKNSPAHAIVSMTYTLRGFGNGLGRL